MIQNTPDDTSAVLCVLFGTSGIALWTFMDFQLLRGRDHEIPKFKV